MAVDRKVLEEYRKATEALLDAISVFESKIRTLDTDEYDRFEELIEKRQQELDEMRRQYKRPKGLKRSG
jgi:hypothetical protein